MTNALIEKVARLLHESYREFHARRWPGSALAPGPWEGEPEFRREAYRNAARAVLRALGH